MQANGELSLGVGLDKVCVFIALAREFQAKEAVVFPEDPAMPGGGDWALQVLADHRDDPCYQEMLTLVQGMDGEEQLNMVALMWLGRGDFSLQQWPEALAQAAERHSAHTAGYLIGTPMVADYLDSALSLLGHSCEGLTC